MVLKKLVQIGVEVHAGVPHVALLILLIFSLYLVMVHANHRLHYFKITLLMNSSPEKARLYECLSNCGLSFENEFNVVGFARGQLNPPMMLRQTPLKHILIEP
jgi:hypothetical protein